MINGFGCKWEMCATGSRISVVLELTTVCSHLFELVHGREGPFEQVGFSPFENWGKNAVTLGNCAARIGNCLC